KTRIWLVLDGDVLYVDRNCNGNLTEDGERIMPRKDQHFFEADIADSDGKTKIGTLQVHFWGPAHQALHENKCLIRIGGEPVFPKREFDGPSFFADRPDNAPVIHFAGPPVLRLLKPPHFVRGQEPRPLNIKDSVNWLQVCLGTPGLGNG